MTLIDNLMVPVLDPHDSDEALTEQAERCLERVGLLDVRGHNGEELSGG